MCLHVLCLSLNAPPLPSFNHINWFLHLLLFLMLRRHFSLSFTLFISLSPLSLNRTFLRMRNPSSLKPEFFKKWMMGLKIYTTSNKNMTLSQRKKAIKLSADIALASSRNCATRWSRALIAGTSLDDGSRLVADVLLGRAVCERLSHTNPKIARVMWSSGKILKRSRRVQRKAAARKKCKKPAAESIAKKLLQKKTKVLRGLVPGGEFMDEMSLMEETLDYISALQAQVDVMRCLATAYIPPSS